MEELRNSGLTEGNERLVLGGGHGVRSYLPRELQRFSIDLDFYSNAIDLSGIKNRLGRMGFNYVGYGVMEEGVFKRYDASLPHDFSKGTLAFTRHYTQQFRMANVPPEFYATVCNDLAIDPVEMKRPRSYIPIEYVQRDLPVLPAEIIIAKVRLITIRPVKVP